MKPAFIAFGLISLSIICSCGNKVVALKQTYQNKPYEFSVSSSKEEVLKQMVDLLSSKGLVVKTIDHTIGLITTEPTSFLHSYSFENKDGSLTNPNASVVCTKVRGPFTFTPSLKPDSVTGQWSITLKPVNNKTLVDITLANSAGKIMEESVGTNGQVSTRETYNLVVKSTGVFEKSIEKSFN